MERIDSDETDSLLLKIRSIRSLFVSSVSKEASIKFWSGEKKPKRLKFTVTPSREPCFIQQGAFYDF
jgi:hypothetical protein